MKTRKKFEVHDFAKLFPETGDDDYQKIQEDMSVRGQVVKVTIFEDMVLDGRTRCAAAEELGLPVEYEYFFGTKEEALNLVVSLNSCRRHLSPGQKAFVASGIARARMQLSGMTMPHAIEKACEETGASVTSTRTVLRLDEMETKVSKKAVAQLKNGRNSIRGAVKDARGEPSALSRCVSAIRTAIREVERAHAIAPIAEVGLRQRQEMYAAKSQLERVLEDLCKGEMV